MYINIVRYIVSSNHVNLKLSITWGYLSQSKTQESSWMVGGRLSGFTGLRSFADTQIKKHDNKLDSDEHYGYEKKMMKNNIKNKCLKFL